MSLRGGSRRASAVCLLAALVASGAGTARVTTAGSPAARLSTGALATSAAPPRTPAASLRGRPLPDTVLASIGDRRTIGAHTFRRSWARITPPERPDSLTPQTARRFLDLLIDKEVLAERAIREAHGLSAPESASLSKLRDRIVMRLVLDSALAGAARDRAVRGDPPLGPELLGVALRESTTARVEIAYDESLLVRLARAFATLPTPADSTFAARMQRAGRRPPVDPGDTARTVAWSGAGDYRVSELCAAWDRLDPLFRPRIATPEQVRDLIKNGLFERMLRREADRRHLGGDPRVVEWMDRQREYLVVQSFVSRNVYARVPTDSLTLRRAYDRDPDAWTVPTRFQAVSLLLPGHGEAARMAAQLRDPAEAESLVTRGLRKGVDYRAEITARDDSVLFAAARRYGAGAVLGPDSVGGGWRVVQIGSLMPARARTFGEVRDQVAQTWTAEEGERRLVSLLASLRGRTRVRINEAALLRLVREGIPGGISDRGS